MKQIGLGLGVNTVLSRLYFLVSLYQCFHFASIVGNNVASSNKSIMFPWYISGTNYGSSSRLALDEWSRDVMERHFFGGITVEPAY